MIIDFHTHIFPPKVRRNRQYYIKQDPLFALLYSRKEAKLATAEELVASMDEASIAISIILNLGWTTHELCKETNDYILESIVRYPKRLVGFCTVQPKSYHAVAEIERCARAGARGIGEMRPDIQSFDLTDEETMNQFVEVLRKHKLILLTHASEPVGHDYRGKGAITPDVLYPFAARYPDIPLVCSHWGGGLPFYALMPEVKEAMKNIYFDTAASPFLYSPQIYRRVADLVGADKILLGTDYPLFSAARLLEEIQSADLSTGEKELIMSENARRLLSMKE
jgi:predicted TIM-barrel fold metal-dependent hydrolase